MTVETHFDGKALTVTKTFHKPIDDVFSAWIDAAKTTHWWGCAHTTRVASTIEPKVGGAYQHLMTIEGVGDHTIEGRLMEYDPPSKLVYTMPENAVSPEMLVTVTFEEADGQTVVTLSQSEIPSEMSDMIAQGWTASFERLAAFFQGQRRAA